MASSYLYQTAVTLLATYITYHIVKFIVRFSLSFRQIPNTVGFFHPYCWSHGGGERVLWHSVKAILDHYPDYTIYIFTDPKTDELKILDSVAHTFKIDLNARKRKPGYANKIKFIKLNTTQYLDASRYPFLTILAQNLASFVVGMEAAYKMVPAIFIESIGFASTMLAFQAHRCKVATYVHYPMISQDMVMSVQTSTHPAFNNRPIFIEQPLLRQLKLFYYKLIVVFYSFIGKMFHIVMVNSNWTKEHIDAMWGVEATVVYPPCDVKTMQNMSLSRFNDNRQGINLISIAQFRPEKNHLIQLEAFKIFLDHTQARKSKLTLYGGVRDEGDRQRVKALEEKISALGLRKYVKIVVGASFDALMEGIKRADVAIHTMRDEHFGIVLLECMAAGLIMVAHDSGGPKKDIIKDGENGFLATGASSFAGKLQHVLHMPKEDRLAVRTEARNTAANFSDEIFSEKFIGAMKSMIK